MCTISKLRKIAKEAPVIPIDDKSRLVIMSDCHRGNGNWGDNFMANQNLFFRALNYYYEQCFTYIELGDGDELWENRSMSDIIRNHSDAYWLMSRLYADKRFYMVYGNHDMQKRNDYFVKKYYENYFCEGKNCIMPLFPGIKIYEGLKLVHAKTKHSYRT